jgi:hypothetical protein
MASNRKGRSVSTEGLFFSTIASLSNLTECMLLITVITQ